MIWLVFAISSYRIIEELAIEIHFGDPHGQESKKRLKLAYLEPVLIGCILIVFKYIDLTWYNVIAILAMYPTLRFSVFDNVFAIGWYGKLFVLGKSSEWDLKLKEYNVNNWMLFTFRMVVLSLTIYLTFYQL